MKTFTRLLALLLACLMLAVVFVACDEGEGDEGGEGTTATADDYGREVDDLPALDYEGQEIKVLYWSDVENLEFDVDQITSDNVSNAIYDRNGEIERRMNVDLTFRGEKGNVENMKGFVTVVSNSWNSNTKDFDLIAAYSRTEGMLALQGYLVEMNNIGESYINLEKPWWPDNMIETVTIGDNMYFISGDISPNVLHMMQVIYFNKSLLNQYWNDEAVNRGYESDRDEKGKEIVSPAARMMYKWAYDGIWTLDKLIELSKGADGTGTWIDNGTKGVEDSNDQFGFTSIHYQTDCFYTGSNLRLVDHVEGDILKISDDYGSAKTVKLISKLGEWYGTTNAYTHGTNDSDANTSYYKPWNNGNAMFTAIRAHSVKNLDVDWDYGVMPVPKYDENQANYYTCMGNPFTLYGIFSRCDSRGDKDATHSMLTAIIECWASESYRRVTPEVFEVNMQLKYADTQYETDMFEIVRSSVVFDLGRIFANDLMFMSELPSKTAVSGASWATTYGAYKNSLKTKLAKIVETLA